MFQEMELLSSNIKKIQEKETSKKIPYVSGNENPKTENFLTFRDRYIQNPNIFRTLIYSKPETNPEHFQASTIECFAKIAT